MMWLLNAGGMSKEQKLAWGAPSDQIWDNMNSKKNHDCNGL